MGKNDHHEEAQLIITGSARLDYFRRSGDSLVGRYFSYRLLPIGIAEAAGDFESIIQNSDMLGNPGEKSLLQAIMKLRANTFKPAFDRLLSFGGFPEPFLRASERFSRKWRRDYRSLLIREDLRDLSRISEIRGIEQLALILPEKVTSPLSVNSLREDLQVAHKTITTWLEALKKIYLIFSISPWSKSIARAIRKEPKFYFYDWTICEDAGARIENAIAVLLLRFVCRMNEMGEGEFDLSYVRDKQGREVDFLIVRDQEPYALIEAKKGESDMSRAGIHFSKALNVPYYQLVCDHDIVEAYHSNRFILPAWGFLALLG